MATVFAGQGLGQFTAAVVSFILTEVFKRSLKTTVCDPTGCRPALDRAWRILYAIGIIPAIIGLYFRLILPETPRFTLDVKDDDQKALSDATRFAKPTGGFNGLLSNGVLSHVSHGVLWDGDCQEPVGKISNSFSVKRGTRSNYWEPDFLGFFWMLPL